VVLVDAGKVEVEPEQKGSAVEQSEPCAYEAVINVKTESIRNAILFIIQKSPSFPNIFLLFRKASGSLSKEKQVFY